MLAGWSKKRVLIAVRTYPVPARNSIEVSCTGGITEDGNWIRLFPVPYRFLDEDKRFTKYQWINVDVTKATNDLRPESYKLNIDSIKIEEMVSPTRGWRARREIVRPLMRTSMCHIKREQEENGSPTLGIFKPAQIRRLMINSADTPAWTQQQLVHLKQVPLFQKSPAQLLEKIRLEFRYDFRCSEATCAGHQMMCTDWEMGQSYRRWRRQYRQDWEKKFRQRWEYEMIHKNDTHFFVGNMHQRPASWIIVGVFYPPRPLMGDLFQ